MYKVYKIHTGIKRIKDDQEFEDFTGDLKKDAKCYMKKHQETTLRGIFLKEKITSNTVQRKIREIILLFEESDYWYVQGVFEDILKYKIETVSKDSEEGKKDGEVKDGEDTTKVEEGEKDREGGMVEEVKKVGEVKKENEDDGEEKIIT